MNQYYYNNNYLFKDMDKYHSKKNGRAIMYTKEIFNEWIKSFSKEKHHKIQKSINDFANKNDYVLSQKNMMS